MSVAFRNIRKVFADGTVALDDFNLAFDKGEFVVLLGPSGSGKTTACRILAGLEQASAGHIEVDGRDISDLPPRARRMSMVFQNYALYGHKSVRDNIAYPLRVRGTPRAEISHRVEEVARLLHIEGLLRRRPRQLSGGEAQRVAVARALVWQPDICLMDEPLSNLDAILRLQTRTELKRLHGELGTTFVFVTHDQEEAMEVADRIVVMNKGVIEQIGTPAEVYANPASEFVYHFLGDANRLQLDEQRSVLFRPHEVSLSHEAVTEHLVGEVRDIRPLGALTRITLKVAGQAEAIEVEVSNNHASLAGLQRGSTLFFTPSVGAKHSEPLSYSD